MAEKFDNFVGIDELIHEIKEWTSSSSATDSESLESDKYEGEYADWLANELIQGVEEMRHLTKDEIWFHNWELSFRSSLTHDQPLFGTRVNFGENINKHARTYFMQSAYRSEKLDWFYSNLLVAYSFQKHRDNSESLTSDIVGGSFYRGTLEFIDGRYMWGTLLILGWGLVRVVKVALILLPFAAADSPYLYPTIVISAATAASILISRNRRDTLLLDLKRKNLEELDSILRVYALAARRPIQWEVFKDQLVATSRVGIGWLSSLYVAASNRSNSKNFGSTE